MFWWLSLFSQLKMSNMMVWLLFPFSLMHLDTLIFLLFLNSLYTRISSIVTLFLTDCRLAFLIAHGIETKFMQLSQNYSVNLMTLVYICSLYQALACIKVAPRHDIQLVDRLYANPKSVETANMPYEH
ncbi:hypothetical protein BDQ12DRAFT_462797 [Crucibulum laeve]|uniref:Uncharacterized protein n=1 Tax=Crucibulum laeve TaxID=68775 RepID=A0A5C3MA28_9AGAR|nr:hypothetical protein BDQ12DRAFT_462797 [Crucibulum laeve]